nr:RNA-dependent RNA polymerase, eukaryotic-type [Tanacetum cinerariifolium]
YACYVSSHSKKIIHSPYSPSINKTIPEYYPCQKQVNFLNSPKTFNPVSCVPKRLIFSSVCGADDAHNNSNISQQPIASQNPEATHAFALFYFKEYKSYIPFLGFDLPPKMIPKFYSNIRYFPVRVFGGAAFGNVDVGCGAMFPNCVDNAIQVTSMTPNQSDIASSLAFSQ